MNDHKRNDGDAGDAAFDRERGLIGSAYKNAAPDLPPPAMDDAIRAAAHRAVKSQPHVVGKSWISRWSAPLSAAALVVLAVSVGLNVNDEPQRLASAPLGEAVAPNAKAIVAPVLPTVPVVPVLPIRPTVATNAVEAGSPAVAAPPPVLALRPTEKKSSMQRQNAAPRDQLTQSPMERERNEVGSATSGKLVNESRRDTAVLDSSPVAAAPSPAPPAASIAVAQETPKETKAFVADPAADMATPRARTAVAAESAKGEMPKDKRWAAPPASAGSAARSDTPAVTQRSAPTLAAPALADKAIESADAWMKRILELKRQNRTREFSDELAKFRKRYPDFALPDELKERK